METRVCICGCKQTFRVFWKSKQKYFSRYHDPNWVKPKSYIVYKKLLRQNFGKYLEKKRKFNKFFKPEKNIKIYTSIEDDFYLRGGYGD